MEKYKLKEFSQWARKEGLSDEALIEALEEMTQGLLGDRIGADIYKKRLGISGRGKRGGLRTILIFRKGDLAVFLYGYAKNEKSDLEPREKDSLKIFAKDFLKLSTLERAQRRKDGAIILIEE